MIVLAVGQLDWVTGVAGVAVVTGVVAEVAADGELVTMDRLDSDVIIPLVATVCPLDLELGEMVDETGDFGEVVWALEVDGVFVSGVELLAGAVFEVEILPLVTAADEGGKGLEVL